MTATNIAQYMEAIRDGNPNSLEQLAVSAGYTRPYDGLRAIKDAGVRLSSSLSTKNPDTILKAINSFCGLMPKKVYQD